MFFGIFFIVLVYVFASSDDADIKWVNMTVANPCITKGSQRAMKLPYYLIYGQKKEARIISCIKNSFLSCWEREEPAFTLMAFLQLDMLIFSLISEDDPSVDIIKDAINLRRKIRKKALKFFLSEIFHTAIGYSGSVPDPVMAKFLKDRLGLDFPVLDCEGFSLMAHTTFYDSHYGKYLNGYFLVVTARNALISKELLYFQHWYPHFLTHHSFLSSKLFSRLIIQMIDCDKIGDLYTLSIFADENTLSSVFEAKNNYFQNLSPEDLKKYDSRIIASLAYASYTIHIKNLPLLNDLELGDEDKIVQSILSNLGRGITFFQMEIFLDLVTEWGGLKMVEKFKRLGGDFFNDLLRIFLVLNASSRSSHFRDLHDRSRVAIKLEIPTDFLISLEQSLLDLVVDFRPEKFTGFQFSGFETIGTYYAQRFLDTELDCAKKMARFHSDYLENFLFFIGVPPFSEMKKLAENIFPLFFIQAQMTNKSVEERDFAAVMALVIIKSFFSRSVFIFKSTKSSSIDVFHSYKMLPKFQSISDNNLFIVFLIQLLCDKDPLSLIEKLNDLKEKENNNDLILFRDFLTIFYCLADKNPIKLFDSTILPRMTTGGFKLEGIKNITAYGDSKRLLLFLDSGHVSLDYLLRFLSSETDSVVFTFLTPLVFQRIVRYGIEEKDASKIANIIVNHFDCKKLAKCGKKYLLQYLDWKTAFSKLLPNLYIKTVSCDKPLIAKINAKGFDEKKCTEGYLVKKIEKLWSIIIYRMQNPENSDISLPYREIIEQILSREYGNRNFEVLFFSRSKEYISIELLVNSYIEEFLSIFPSKLQPLQQIQKNNHKEKRKRIIKEWHYSPKDYREKSNSSSSDEIPLLDSIRKLPNKTKILSQSEIEELFSFNNKGDGYIEKESITEDTITKIADYLRRSNSVLSFPLFKGLTAQLANGQILLSNKHQHKFKPLSPRNLASFWSPKAIYKLDSNEELDFPLIFKGKSQPKPIFAKVKRSLLDQVNKLALARLQSLCWYSNDVKKLNAANTGLISISWSNENHPPKVEKGLIFLSENSEYLKSLGELCQCSIAPINPKAIDTSCPKSTPKPLPSVVKANVQLTAAKLIKSYKPNIYKKEDYKILYNQLFSAHKVSVDFEILGIKFYGYYTDIPQKQIETAGEYDIFQMGLAIKIGDEWFFYTINIDIKGRQLTESDFEPQAYEVLKTKIDLKAHYETAIPVSHLKEILTALVNLQPFITHNGWVDLLHILKLLLPEGEFKNVTSSNYREYFNMVFYRSFIDTRVLLKISHPMIVGMLLSVTCEFLKLEIDGTLLNHTAQFDALLTLLLYLEIIQNTQKLNEESLKGKLYHELLIEQAAEQASKLKK
jgi:hypothetical protein